MSDFPVRAIPFGPHVFIVDKVEVDKTKKVFPPHVALYHFVIYSRTIKNKDIGRYVSFITHGRFRSKNPTFVLTPAHCKTATFHAVFFLQ